LLNQHYSKIIFTFIAQKGGSETNYWLIAQSLSNSVLARFFMKNLHIKNYKFIYAGKNEIKQNNDTEHDSKNARPHIGTKPWTVSLVKTIVVGLITIGFDVLIKKAY
jgi:nucleoside diphosphate kinase